jgi:hypothetical protein
MVPQPQPATEEQDNAPPFKPMVLQPYQTAENSFNLFRRYLTMPSHEPDEHLTPADFNQSEISGETTLPTAFTSSAKKASTDDRSPIWPFPNISSLLFLHWFHNGQTQKSHGKRSSLIDTVFHHPYFNAAEVSN